MPGRIIASAHNRVSAVCVANRDFCPLQAINLFTTLFRLDTKRTCTEVWANCEEISECLRCFRHVLDSQKFLQEMVRANPIAIKESSSAGVGDSPTTPVSFAVLLQQD